MDTVSVDLVRNRGTGRGVPLNVWEQAGMCGMTLKRSKLAASVKGGYGLGGHSHFRLKGTGGCTTEDAKLLFFQPRFLYEVFCMPERDVQIRPFRRVL